MSRTLVSASLNEILLVSIFEEQETNELALDSFEEKRNKFVYLWALIPLTRAIDTLVIMINNKDSKLARALRKVYEECPDIVQWIE